MQNEENERKPRISFWSSFKKKGVQFTAEAITTAPPDVWQYSLRGSNPQPTA